MASGLVDGRRHAVVNVCTFADARDFTFSSSATDFDGEDAGSRLARRQKYWIPDVEIRGS